MYRENKSDFLNYRLRFFWLAMFAIAMGILEGIVVVYLRELYYPEGFDFPVRLMPQKIVAVEWTREIATLVMLAGVGIMTGRNNLQRLFYSLFAFGIWDIFYYAALKLFLGWPPSLMTWDLLFLIPFSWLGPVLAPIINSLTMIIMALLIIRRQEKGFITPVKAVDWSFIIAGAVLILFTYLVDYGKLITDSGVLSARNQQAAGEKLLDMITSYVPGRFRWLLFIAGELLIIAATVKILLQTHKPYNNEKIL